MSDTSASGSSQPHKGHNPWAPAGWEDDEVVVDAGPVVEISESAPVSSQVSRTDHPEFFQPKAAPITPDLFVTEIAGSPSPTPVAEVTATTMSTAPTASTLPTAPTEDMTVVSVVNFDASHIREPLTFLPLEATTPKARSFAELVALGAENVKAAALAASAALAAAEVSSEPSNPLGSTDSASLGTSTQTAPSQFGVSDSFAVMVDKDAPADAPAAQWVLKADGAVVRALSAQHGHVLGRTPSSVAGKEADLLLGIEDTTGTVSRTHARLDFVDGVWRITDLNSTNGVLVYDPVAGEHELVAGESYPVTGRFLLGDLELELAQEPSDV